MLINLINRQEFLLETKVLCLQRQKEQWTQYFYLYDSKNKFSRNKYFYALYHRGFALIVNHH